MKKGFNNTCEKILGSEDAEVQAYLQLEAFRRKEGTFGSSMALKTANKMPAYQWWSANIDDDEAPELKQVAEKVYVHCCFYACLFQTRQCKIRGTGLYQRRDCCL